MNITKDHIKDVYIKIVSKNPTDKISISNLVQACGINRNTFYYHFSDLYDLQKSINDDIVKKMINECIKENVDAYEISAKFFDKYKDLLIALFWSKNREEFEILMWDYCDKLASEYVKNIWSDKANHIDDMNALIDKTSGVLFGDAMNYFRHNGFKDNSKYNRIRVMRKDLIKSQIDKLKNN